MSLCRVTNWAYYYYYYYYIEEGLPNRGVLEVTYYSGDGVQNDGCIVHPEFRRSLLYMVSIVYENKLYGREVFGADI